MDTLYINLPQKKQVTVPKVSIGQIATVLCQDKHIEAQVKATTIASFTSNQKSRVVCEATTLIRKIQTLYPSIDITTLGETSVLIEYLPSKELKKINNKLLLYLKLSLISLILFFGGAFTMITFNNDISASEAFQSIYETFTGRVSNGFTVLEIGYAIGLPIGILVFFNHLCGHRLSTDPTPVEVSMVTYESDVNQTLITHAQREAHQKGDLS